jgi:hypothetical protein
VDDRKQLVVEIGARSVLEQMVDLDDDRRIRAPQLISGLGQGKSERMCCPAAEAGTEQSLVRFGQRHVLQNDADYALSFAVRSGGIAPEAREIGHRGHDLLTLLGTQHATFVSVLT